MKAAALLAALAGCYTTVSIRPDQIPLLSGARTTSVGPVIDMPLYTGTGAMTTMPIQGFQRSHVTMLAPDGDTVTVKGDADLDIDTVAGVHYHFEHPIDASLDGGALTISAANRSGRIALAEVRRARVRSLSLGKSIGAAVGGSLAFSALMLVPLLL